jgi:hypothetical protein
MSQALVQMEAPEANRGAIIGLFNTSINGLRVGSGLTVGFLGAIVGVHWSLGLASAILLASMFWLLTYVKAEKAPAGVVPVEASCAHSGCC